MLTDRYVHPEMGRIWSEEAKFDAWMEVETAAAEVMAEAGIIPKKAAKEIRARGAYSIERIDAIEKDVKHDVIAFTQAMVENVGDAGAVRSLRAHELRTSSTPRSACASETPPI